MLQLSIGFVSLTGKRESNQDYVGACMANNLRGTIAAVADGVGGGKGGREAAELAVRGFTEAYYELPDTLSVERAAGKALAVINRWIHSQGKQDTLLQNMATTFSAVILRRRQAHIIHVGDSRIYRLRDQQLSQLTHDHTLPQPGLDHVLYRAVGMEEGLRADYAVHPLEPYDRFLLCSDGVHGVLSKQALLTLLAKRASPQESAQTIADTAIASGSTDNVTALVLDVIELPAADQTELESAISALPIHDLPRVGETIDEFRLLEIISDGRYSRLFKAEDVHEHRLVVLKFPHPRITGEAAYYRTFIHEAWIAARVRNPCITEIITLSPGRQSRLYSVMPFYEGITLEERLKRPPGISLAEGTEIAIQLAKAVYALNRRGIIHRDVKPENILLLKDGSLKLLDLGVARLPGLEESGSSDIPGTPSYMAPELFNGEAGDEQSDVYALGVTVYRLFSGGHYPYGEMEPFSRPRFGKHTALTQHRPDLPMWLDMLLTKATAVEKSERLGDAMELAFELENGKARGGPVVTQKQPLYHRNPLLFWQLASLLLFLALLMAVLGK